jgi:hypothetical protein
MSDDHQPPPPAAPADAPPVVDVATRPMPYGRAPTDAEFERFLIVLHDVKRLWRICPRKRCKRARRCRGDLDDCIRCLPEAALWQEQFINALRAGLSGAEARREACRVAFAPTE